MKQEEIKLGKKGIVRDKNVHLDVLKKIVTFAQQEGFQLLDLTYSPITGGDGNIEFLAHLGWKNEKEESESTNVELESVVEDAHHDLKANKKK